MTTMRNAEHLAGALALEMGQEVTWHPMPERDAVIFECNGHKSVVGRWDLFNLHAMAPERRQALVQRVRRKLEGAG